LKMNEMEQKAIELTAMIKTLQPILIQATNSILLVNFRIQYLTSFN
jgi:hypothetical protein